MERPLGFGSAHPSMLMNLFDSHDTARAMWKVLLDGRWALVDEWCEFLAKAPDCKVITRDTWSQALEFSRTIAPDMEGYDPAGAWPYLIDEFVEQKLETIQAEKNA